jgi:hypothetical protein
MQPVLRTLLALVLLLGVAACGDKGITTEGTGVFGTYDLVSFDGQSLPVIIEDDECRTSTGDRISGSVTLTELTASVLTLRADHTYTLRLTGREACRDAAGTLIQPWTSHDETTDPEDFTVSGSIVTFYTGSMPFFTGTLAGRRLTLSLFIHNWVFEKR